MLSLIFPHNSAIFIKAQPITVLKSETQNLDKNLTGNEELKRLPINVTYRDNSWTYKCGMSVIFSKTYLCVVLCSFKIVHSATL